MYKNKYTANVSKTPHRNRLKPTLLDGCMDWCVIVDVVRQLAFAMEITSTCKHPDLVIWSVNSKKVIIADITIPFKANINWVHHDKLEKYEDLHEQCVKNGWLTDIFRLEIECRGFNLNSTSTFLTKLRLSPAEIQNKTNCI